MAEKTKNKTYTVADLYTEASKMVQTEMQGHKGRPLTQDEVVKMERLARLISNSVLKEMKLV